MQANSVDAGKGPGWYGTGWRIFMANPGMWIALTVIWAVISVVIGLVPLLGGLVSALLAPAFAGGMLFAAREAHEGRPVDINQLFIGLKDEEKRGPMLTLGAVSMVFGLLIMLIMMVAIGGSMGAAAMLHGAGNQEAMMAGMGLGMLVAWLLATLAGLLASMALFYAIPLVMFAATPPLEAIKSSVGACLSNWLPLLLFGLVGMLLALLAAIPLLLGYLILVPVTIGASYASYHEIYAG